MKKSLNSAEIAVVPSVTKTVFAFKKRPLIAPKGLQKGVFILAENQSGGEGDNAFSVLHTQVEVADAQGHRHVVAKDYNIMQSGRGINAFLQDYNEWSGAGLTEDDLYNEFDMDTVVKGKPVVVEIDHRKVGKDWEAFIGAFHPDGFTMPVDKVSLA